MATCATCGREVGCAFQITIRGETLVFDSFECAIDRLAPHCPNCGSAITGHGYRAGSELFCGFRCREEARLDRRVDAASAASFPASDPPASFMSTPSRTAKFALDRRRRQEGRVGWVLLWLLGIPLPVLLGLFVLRGCT